MKITWRRTVIAGEIKPEDFIGEDENGRTIGRIYRHHSGGWFYAFQAHGPDIGGRMVRHQALLTKSSTPPMRCGRCLKGAAGGKACRFISGH